jgi:hypothetical protein|tara:strand:+ start:510 stop:1358 length:849 start_codon:yes stop_codon:yes gene_type:complete
MKFPLRHLQKLIAPNIDLSHFEITDENLELLIETLRELEKCRKSTIYLKNEFEINLFLSSKAFGELLQINEINVIEVPTKSGDVERTSLNESRKTNDPISVSNLNATLRELNRDLLKIQNISQKEFEKILLAKDIKTEFIEEAWETVLFLKQAKDNLIANIFNRKKRKIAEQKLKNFFPNLKIPSSEAQFDHLLKELAFFRQCADLNKKWIPIGLNLISCFNQGNLDQAIQNVQEMGSSMWTAVYNGQQLPETLKLAGIWFGDIATIFENPNLASLKESPNQ